MSTTGPGQSVDLLMDVVAILDTAKIKYAVIGALAASVHGVVRASLDADAVIHSTVGDLIQLKSELTSAGLKTELRRGDSDDPIPALLLVSDKHGNRVDLLAGLRGMEAATYQRVIEVKLPGTPTTLRVVGREDLIAMKVFAGGPQDLVDARRCIAVADSELDLKLLQHVVAGYGREAVATFEKLLAESNKTQGR